MEEDRTTVLVRIRGRVQGVGYRAWTRHQAIGYGIDGWVRNEPDGTVAAFFAGPSRQVRKLLEILWQGPYGAAVEDVAATATDIAAPANGFHITRPR